MGRCPEKNSIYSKRRKSMKTSLYCKMCGKMICPDSIQNSCRCRHGSIKQLTNVPFGIAFTVKEEKV
jgi:hypothetical protein